MAISQHDLREHTKLVSLRDRVSSILERRSPEARFYARVRRKPLGEPIRTFASLIDVDGDGWMDEVIDAIILENPADPIKVEIIPRGGQDVVAGCSLPPLLEAMETLAHHRAERAKAEGESAMFISLVEVLRDLVVNDRHERNVFFQAWKEAENRKLEIEHDLLETRLLAEWGVDDPEDPDVVKWKEIGGALKGALTEATKPLSGLGALLDHRIAQHIEASKQGKAAPGSEQDKGKSTETEKKAKDKEEKVETVHPTEVIYPGFERPNLEGKEEQASEEQGEQASADEVADTAIELLDDLLNDAPELLTAERLQRLTPHHKKLKLALSVLDAMVASAEETGE